MASVVLPLGALHAGEPSRRYYVVAEDADGEFEAGWPPVALTASDDRSALAAALVSYTADELRCVPELAAAGREASVATREWTPDLRSIAACEVVRHAFPNEYLLVRHGHFIGQLISGAALLIARPPPERELWIAGFRIEGYAGPLQFHLAGVALAHVGARTSDGLFVFRSDEDGGRFLQPRDGRERPAFLAIELVEAPAPVPDPMHVGNVMARVPVPKASLPSGEVRGVDELECHVLAALAGAVGILRRGEGAADFVHSVASGGVESMTRLENVERREVPENRAGSVP